MPYAVGHHCFDSEPENPRAVEVSADAAAALRSLVPAYSSPSVSIFHGDNLAVLPLLATGSVDAVVTDPPYGLGFMGKGWDDPKRMTSPALICEECGNDEAAEGFRFCMDCLPKMSPREPAHGGKSMLGHVSKNWSDKGTHSRGYADNDPLAFGEWCRVWATACLRTLRPGAHLLAFGGTRTFHRLTCALEDAGFEIRDCLSWLYGSGFPKSHNGPWGGTALKPAWEPIVVARKPLGGTVAACHARHGTGGLAIDRCRIPGAKAGGSGGAPMLMGGTNQRPFSSSPDFKPRDFDTSLGRWPANVALDEEAARMLDEQAGERGGGFGVRGGGGGGEWNPTDRATARGQTIRGGGEEVGYGDSGGASRFFYTAKASRSEREEGIEGLPVREVQSGMGGAMPTDDEGRARDRFKVRARNTHPTVKPLDLMRWLVRLVTPVGGIVLDPYLGSGTTALACREEGVTCIGIEREAEYVEIARGRLSQGVLPFTAPTAPPPPPRAGEE